MSEDFLPKDYNVDEAKAKYMRFEGGDNKFRFLDKPLVGYEYWVHADGLIVQRDEKPQQGNKPVRIAKPTTGDPSIPVDVFEASKEFWAMPVWNYKTEQVQVLEITQKSILRDLTGLARSKDWGSPLNYDNVVS